MIAKFIKDFDEEELHKAYDRYMPCIDNYNMVVGELQLRGYRTATDGRYYFHPRTATYNEALKTYDNEKLQRLVTNSNLDSEHHNDIVYEIQRRRLISSNLVDKTDDQLIEMAGRLWNEDWYLYAIIDEMRRRRYLGDFVMSSYPQAYRDENSTLKVHINGEQSVRKLEATMKAMANAGKLAIVDKALKTAGEYQRRVISELKATELLNWYSLLAEQATEERGNELLEHLEKTDKNMDCIAHELQERWDEYNKRRFVVARDGHQAKQWARSRGYNPEKVKYITDVMQLQGYRNEDLYCLGITPKNWKLLQFAENNRRCTIIYEPESY